MRIKENIKKIVSRNKLTFKMWEVCRVFKEIIKIFPCMVLDYIFIIFRKLGISKKYSYLEQFRDKYKGKRCFIIATGPSLTYDDIEKLKNEYTIGVNSIASALDKMSYSPTFYMIQDGRVFERIKKNIKNEKLNTIFLGYGFFSFMKKIYYKNLNCNVYPLNCSYNMIRAIKGKYNKYKFSNDFSKVVYNGHTVVYSAIELAVYMGFSEIYLLGVDCNYVKGVSNFEDHGLRDDNVESRMLNAYYYVKEWIKDKNVSIYNATRGGMLEVFPRVDLDDVLERTE